MQIEDMLKCKTKDPGKNNINIKNIIYLESEIWWLLKLLLKFMVQLVLTLIEAATFVYLGFHFILISRYNTKLYVR